MDTQSLVTLAAAGLTFVASIIAIMVSAYNARLGRFARQRWWERKVRAYADIIEALADLVYYYEEHYDAMLGHQRMSDEFKDRAQEHWKRGYTAIKKATAVGAFLISAEAETALRTMWKEMEKGVPPGDFFILIESEYAAARDCLKTVVEAAKADLKKP
jgi:hypothetical protein